MEKIERKEKIEERKGIVTIGMISSGKSTFLNSIFGFNYLQVNDDITTKFICIIRYNPNIEEPLFYNLILIPKESNPNEYDFIKNGEKFVGKKNIKHKIQKINEEQHNSNEPNYDNLFWMLETNKATIENKLFLQKYDFYDIPGLNEYILDNTETEKNFEKKDADIKENNGEINLSEDIKDELSSNINDENAPPIINGDKNELNKIEEIPKNEKEEEHYKYIKGIFKYLKGKIENFIFIISTESCYKPANLRIIEEIRKNIDFDFEGALFILTKIDLVEEKKKKIEEFKKYFVNNISPNIFNIYFNVFVPLTSKEFKIEMLRKEKNTIFYAFIEDIMMNITMFKKKKKPKKLLLNI